MENSFKLVFSNYRYSTISILITLGLFFSLSIVSEYLFIEPYVVFAVYPDTAFNFSLIVIISILAGIVVSMNIFRVRLVKKVRKIGSSITGTIIGASAGACSCGPIGFSIITTFGTTGSIASSFLTNYELPLRLISIIILVLVLWTTLKSISRECKIT
ncbi:MAG: hypothetical protein QF559_02045 [Candidatus Nitrosopelagicus sp.]|nr:hypothetical protein [Candidatus Nitrosopelagicus sp.]